MSKSRLIKRLSWYYPTEKFHTYISFPGICLFVIIRYPISEIILLLFGLFVCMAILYQGQHYWKLKLQSLKGIHFNQTKEIQFFKSSKKMNYLLMAMMPLMLLIQLFVLNWDVGASNLLFWGLLANILAILEHINYYHTQLMVDNIYDVKYIMKNKKFKKASLSKDLEERKIEIGE